MSEKNSQIIIAPQEGKQTLALNIEADVIFCGGSAGSAKSFTLLMRMLSYMDDPNFDAIYFRRTTVQIKGQGGLWDNAKDLYQSFDADCVDSKLIAEFPSGAKAKFAHLELEKNKIDHQGLAYSAIFFDELTHFSETQFTYLLSRLRSDAKTSSFVMASMNPDNDSWVLKWVKPFLDEDGYFNEEMAGKLLYYVTIEGQPVFANTREELVESFPHSVWVTNPNTKEKVYIAPKSFTFLGSTIFDNQILIDKNPNYLAELQSLPNLERARLLYGNWYARAEGSNDFERNWLTKLDKIPSGVFVRAWDKASSEPSEVERFPDFTASIKMIKTSEGRFCIIGDFCPENQEGDGIYKGRFRKRAGERDSIILKQSQWDGRVCKVILPVDVGAAGKTEYQHSAKQLIAKGHVVRPDPMPTNKSKLIKYSPFSSACQAGLVDIVESTFPDPQTLEMFYKENEAFTGERSTRQRKDDWPDTCATAFNYLNESEVIPSFTLPEFKQTNPFDFIS
jgi:phage terminase large subunit-like protein